MEVISTKVKQGTNVLKAIRRAWWGADPATLRLAYNGIVRSHLDFESFLFQPTNKKVLNTLNVLQRQALRLIMGCMDSTPIKALLAEAGEMELPWRRKWLALKLMAKVSGYLDHPLINVIKGIQQGIKNKHKYWIKKDIPECVWAWEQLKKYYPIVQHSHIRPCFQIPYTNQITNHSTIDLLLNKYTNNKTAFKSATERFNKEYTFAYTDGSKQEDKVGIVVYIPSLRYRYMERIPPLMNICDAEILAINKAGTVILEN